MTSIDTSILELSPEERRERGVSPEDVNAALVAVLESDDAEEKRLGDVTLPRIDLDFVAVEGTDNHPLDLRGATIEGGITAERADIRVPLRLDGATVGGIDCDNAAFGGEVSLAGATVTGPVDAFEARFDGDVDCTGTTFEAEASFDEAVFDNDVRFVDTEFGGATSFRGTEFHGRAVELGDSTSFRGATFRDAAEFVLAGFGATDLADATFEGSVAFERATFDGFVDLSGVTFEGMADFDEVRFEHDVRFEDAAFRGPVDFRGAEFRGGSNHLQADASFAGTTFAAGADFRQARFRYANFEGVAFDGEAMFQEVEFDADADFVGVTFGGEADFDEARFREDTDFSGSRFVGACVFRGAEFMGGANHLEDDARFEGVAFEADADFDNAVFTSANFLEARFDGEVDFSGAVFEDRLDFEATAAGDDAYVDFTDAKLTAGHIVQPRGDWVRYDLTRASLGEVELDAADPDDHRHLLDYFRFCLTEFDEFDGHDFDFSNHLDYLDRNRWRLHTFAAGDADHGLAVEMTPMVVERTYMKAKNAASNAGDRKAAGEFRVKRQQYARETALEIARDATEDAETRLRNALRAGENFFLGATCGHGMRLLRILAVFFLIPVVPAFVYAFGGPPFRTGAGQLSSLGQLATPEGQAIMYENLHFSYITYLTVGYGNIGPQGALARMFAGVEVYLSVILGGLVIYALVKRSEL